MTNNTEYDACENELAGCEPGTNKYCDDCNICKNLVIEHDELYGEIKTCRWRECCKFELNM